MSEYEYECGDLKYKILTEKSISMKMSKYEHERYYEFDCKSE